PFGSERGDAALCGRQPLLAGTPTDPAQLSARLLDPGRGAELLEASERGLDRVPGDALLSYAPSDDSEREQRARAAEGVTDGFVLRDRVLEERGGRGDVPARRCDEATAAYDVSEHPVASESSRIRLPRIEDSHGVVHPLEREQGFDLVAGPPPVTRRAPSEPRGLRLGLREPFRGRARVAALQGDDPRTEIGRAHVSTPITDQSSTPSSSS